jgi:thiol-disulfide isomerase/thioredoxin
MNNSNSSDKMAFVEVIYEGDHCLPCVYMAEVVEEAVKKFGDRVKWEKVVLKRRKGAQRYAVSVNTEALRHSVTVY